MTTIQAPTNGHRVFQPPCSFPDSQEETQSENSTNNFNSTPVSPTPSTEAFPASAYHVPRARYAPKAHAYRRDDYLEPQIDTTPLPERCQFMFSDGRQCTMGRSEIHPSLCFYHADREEQLFGDPSCRCEARKLDFPELYSACRDLTTAAGVNRALGQVFRLLAQRRISRQEAATFAKLGHLLLQSISAASRESLFATNVYPQDELRGAEKSNQELSRVNKVRVAFVPRADLAAPRPPSPSLAATLPIQQASPSPQDADTCGAPGTPEPPVKPEPSFRATIWSEESLSHPANSEESFPTSPVKNSLGMNTSTASVCNSREISTYENIELKVVHNEHLRKNGRAV